VTTWAYDGQTVAATYAGAGAQAHLTHSYTVLPGTGVVIADRDASTGTTSYPVTDGIGSVTAELSGQGSITSRIQYGAFGDPHAVGGSATDQAYGFTGHAQDADTGLTYARARWYDPSVGRFLDQDPLPATNAYTYANNRPLDLTDPSGGSEAAEYGGLVGSVEGRIYIGMESLADEVGMTYARLIADAVDELATRELMEILPEMLSEDELAAFTEAQANGNFGLMTKFIGQAFHRGTAQILEEWGYGETITYSNSGVDFTINAGEAGTRWIELTTRSQVAVKFGKGIEYAKSLVVTYAWPGFF
jgi:RHS repeat-associated protein